MSNKKTPPNIRPFKVYAIEQGTVIDHIPAGKGLALIDALKLLRHQKIVSLGFNFESKKHKLKDIVKIEGKELTPEEMNQVAVLMPNATINIIRDFKVAEKFKPEIPEVVYKIIKCPNPKCITNSEKIETKFNPVVKRPLKVKCFYCERIFNEDEIILNEN